MPSRHVTSPAAYGHAFRNGASLDAGSVRAGRRRPRRIASGVAPPLAARRPRGPIRHASPADVGDVPEEPDQPGVTLAPASLSQLARGPGQRRGETRRDRRRPAEAARPSRAAGQHDRPIVRATNQDGWPPRARSETGSSLPVRLEPRILARPARRARHRPGSRRAAADRATRRGSTTIQASRAVVLRGSTPPAPGKASRGIRFSIGSRVAFGQEVAIRRTAGRRRLAGDHRPARSSMARPSDGPSQPARTRQDARGRQRRSRADEPQGPAGVMVRRIRSESLRRQLRGPPDAPVRSTWSLTSLPSRLTTTSTLSPGLYRLEALHVVVDRADRLAADAGRSSLPP